MSIEHVNCQAYPEIIIHLSKDYFGLVAIGCANYMRYLNTCTADPDKEKTCPYAERLVDANTGILIIPPRRRKQIP